MVRTKKRNKIKQDVKTNFVINTILIVIGLVALYPIWFVLIASISDPGLIGAGKILLISKGITFDAYTKLKDYPEIFIGYRNSIFYLFAGSFNWRISAS